MVGRVQSEASSVAEYLAELPDDRKVVLEQVLAEIRPHLPEGLEEEMGYGMITWVVPLATVPKTYNGKPLMYAALASQKNYVSLYLMSIYGSEGDAAFRAKWRGAKKPNMGKSCIRFTSVEDIDLDLIKATLDDVSVADFVAAHDAAQSLRKQKGR